MFINTPPALSLFLFLVVVLVGFVVLVMCAILTRRHQVSHVTDAFGHALSEQQLCSDSQILGMLQEAEAHYSSFTGAQLLLHNTHTHTLFRHTTLTHP